MLYFVTGNTGKVDSANRRLLKYKFSLTQHKIEDILEIQSEDINAISMYKAKQAFEILKQPLVVMDSAWYITALNGFPGAYMAYMNDWFTAQDFLNLMLNKANREIFLEEVVTFIADHEQRTFTHKMFGKVLNEQHGEGISSDTIISLSETGKSIAECKALNIKSSEQKGLWEDFGEWYSKH